MSSSQRVALVIWFYIGWFGCVFFAKWGISNWSFVFPLLPFVFLLKSRIVSQWQLFLILLFSIVGIIFDSFFYYIRLIQFIDHESLILPIWLVAMWFLFAAIFPVSIPFFRHRLWLAAILGSVFGPLSYFSGEAFHLVSFQSHFSILIYAIFWGVYFPGIHFIYRKLA